MYSGADGTTPRSQLDGAGCQYMQNIQDRQD